MPTMLLSIEATLAIIVYINAQEWLSREIRETITLKIGYDNL